MNEVAVDPEYKDSDIRTLTVSEHLRNRKERLKRELMEIEELQKRMNENPATQEIIDRLSRLGYR